eukprot:TRINITY_DN6016_c1_g1_i1.p3 TRINITY_DN6016_c1_g1~~TRINITY_DN6016_c1_g1_i1.p3  ORF type:complete len:302 (+),score=110.64 TRINITY_DN6016_c1_g1_i1:85-906(+)
MAAALVAAAAAALSPSPNLPCRPMREYMPKGVPESYNMSKHNGTWYEVAFRDLYPRGPLCFCQQSVKYVNERLGYIDDYFVFSCGPDYPRVSYISPQRENVTDGATGEKHIHGSYDMYVRDSAFKFITHYEWNSEVVGFKDDGKDQYQWVIEYQCGTRPDLPPALCLNNTADGKCFFTGIQLYVRDLDYLAQGKKEMVDYIKSLGPEATGSLPIAWVMDDFSGGTFPPWFVDNDWRQNCPLPCKEGCYNQTTGMWGCCMDQPGLRVAAPVGFQ